MRNFFTISIGTLVAALTQQKVKRTKWRKRSEPRSLMRLRYGATFTCRAPLRDPASASALLVYQFRWADAGRLIRGVHYTFNVKQHF
jgi:hypothetical protein